MDKAEIKKEVREVKKHFLLRLGDFIKFKLLRLIGKVDKKQEEIRMRGK